jgi:hypothetical protein
MKKRENVSYEFIKKLYKKLKQRKEKVNGYEF